jgi:outer membrane protein
MKKYLLIVLLLSMQLYAKAQQKELSLQECLKYALDNNHNLKRTRLDERTGAERIKEVRASAYPQLDASGRFTDNFKKQVIIVPGEFLGQPKGTTATLVAGTTYNAIGQFDLNQQIFNKSIFVGLKAAKTSNDYYKLLSQLSEEQVIEQVATQYYQVQVTRKQLEQVNTNLDKVNQLVKITETQYKNGLAKKIDLDRINVNLTNLQTQQTQIQNGIEQQENGLKYYMGMNLDTPIVLPLIDVNLIKKDLTSVQNNPFDFKNILDYQVLKKQEVLNKLDKANEQAGYYPNLSAFANYNYNSVSNKFDVFNPSGGTAIGYGVGYFGLALRLSVFDGFARRARIAQKNIVILQTQEQIQDRELSLALANKNALTSLQNNLNTIKFQEQNVTLANEVYSSTQNNYHNGLASLTDLLDAETSLREAQNNYSQALLNYKLAEIALIKSNGTIKSLLQ